MSIGYDHAGIGSHAINNSDGTVTGTFIGFQSLADDTQLSSITFSTSAHTGASVITAQTFKTGQYYPAAISSITVSAGAIQLIGTKDA